MVAMATSLRTSKSAMSSSDSLTPKPTPIMKPRVASYHTTKVIAHQTPKPVIAHGVPKLVAMATIFGFLYMLCTLAPPEE